MCMEWIVFFLQAEDGIRDRNVTGVQTCALPISCYAAGTAPSRLDDDDRPGDDGEAEDDVAQQRPVESRSEERRVGKDRRQMWRQKPEKGRKRRQQSKTRQMAKTESTRR